MQQIGVGGVTDLSQAPVNGRLHVEEFSISARRAHVESVDSSSQVENHKFWYININEKDLKLSPKPSLIVSSIILVFGETDVIEI